MGGGALLERLEGVQNSSSTALKGAGAGPELLNRGVIPPQNMKRAFVKTCRPSTHLHVHELYRRALTQWYCARAVRPMSSRVQSHTKQVPRSMHCGPGPSKSGSRDKTRCDQQKTRAVCLLASPNPAHLDDAGPIAVGMGTQIRRVDEGSIAVLPGAGRPCA